MWMKSPRWVILVGVAGCASNPPPAATTAPASASSATSTAAAAPASAAAGCAGGSARGAARPKLRAPEAILADAVKATGGAAAWNAHKTAHYKVETTLQGMGMGGTGERYQTRGDKSLMTMTMAGLGRRARGNERQGRLDGGSGPGHPAISTASRPSRRGSRRRGTPTCTPASCSPSWKPPTEPGPDGAPLECVVATPKLGSPLRSCYDAKTHLQVSQSGVRAGPQGDMPFRAIIREWRDDRRREDPVREQHPAGADHDARSGHVGDVRRADRRQDVRSAQAPASTRNSACRAR